jgi:Domain of unknown function (DUF4411)
MTTSPIWCLDTSSLISLRSQFSREDRKTVLDGLSKLVAAGRLRFPRELIGELERYEGADNPALTWAREHQGAATELQPSFEEVAAVLAEVPEVLDADKEGVEEADAYVLALAQRLTVNGEDARVVTEEFKTTVATHEYLFPSRPTARCPEPQRPNRWDFGKWFRALAKGGRRSKRPHSRPAARRSDDPDDARRSGPDRPQGHGTSLTRARAVSAPHARAARVNGEPDRDRAISREARQTGTATWYTYRHSARQACQ